MINLHRCLRGEILRALLALFALLTASLPVVAQERSAEGFYAGIFGALGQSTPANTFNGPGSGTIPYIHQSPTIAVFAGTT